ncbi:MAG: hypothetical protein JST84_14155 [Acidobacteria bacterium]|nr:hypothetical protein [Acidobacteriota bacterium]
MTDAIIWLAAIGLVVLMFGSLIYEQRRRTKMTDEEYQRRAKEEPGLISTGMMALDQIAFRPQAKAAVEYQKDKMRGQTPDQKSQGEKLPDENIEPQVHTD